MGYEMKHKLFAKSHYLSVATVARQFWNFLIFFCGRYCGYFSCIRLVRIVKKFRTMQNEVLLFQNQPNKIFKLSLIDCTESKIYLQSG